MTLFTFQERRRLSLDPSGIPIVEYYPLEVNPECIHSIRPCLEYGGWDGRHYELVLEGARHVVLWDERVRARLSTTQD